MKSEKTTVKIPEEISSRAEFKRKFTLWELYRSFIYLPGAISRLSKNRKTKQVDPQFIERLQLAVTEVNGCAACSYQHTKMALAQGMSNEEISGFLTGEDSFIKPEEAKAILFAQHFADSRGFPTKIAYEAILEEYGKETAPIILAAIQMMISGNMYGIPFSAFQSRLKGKKFKGSSLFYELGMLLIGFILFPIGLLNGLLWWLFHLPIARFDSRTDED